MLDEKCKVLLRWLIKNEDELNKTKKISEFIVNAFPQYNDVLLCIDYLSQQRYITASYTPGSSFYKDSDERKKYSILSPLGVLQTINELEIRYEGYNLKELNKLKVKEFFKKSILTPVTVSALTAVIVLFVESLF